LACLSEDELILATAISLTFYIISNYVLLGGVFAYYAFITSAIYFLGMVLGLYLASYALKVLGTGSC